MAYTWPDGSKNHTISWSQHQANLQTQQGTPLGYWGGLPGAANAQAQAPAAAAPAAAPVAPTSNPLIEGAYSTSTGNAYTNEQNTFAGISQGENQLGSDYGYTIVRNADGTVDTNATLAGAPQDASVNPFSKMAMLSHAYQNTQRGTTNSYAAQGQLYSSAVGNQRTTDTYNNDAAVDAAKKEFQSSLLGYNNQRTSASNDYSSSVSGAGWQRASAYLGGS